MQNNALARRAKQIADEALYRGILAGAGGGSGGDNVGENADINSLVWGDVSQPEWTILTPGNAPQVQANAGPSEDGYLDATLVNPLNATGFFVLDQTFVAPAGVTEVSFEADIMSGPAGSNTFQILVMNGLGSLALATTNVTTTPTMTTYTTGPVAVVAGTVYRARVWFGTVSNPAQGIIGRVRVRVLATTNPLFAAPWVRYNSSPGMLWDNGHDELLTYFSIYDYRNVSSGSRMVFDTDAVLIGIQILNLVATSTPLLPFSQTLVVVNGRPWATVIGAGGTYDVQEVTLPTGTKRVELVTSFADNVNPTVEPVYEWSYASFVQSVIAPLGSALTQIPPPHENCRIIFFGDSKDTGYAAASPMVQGWPALLRKDLPGIGMFSESQASSNLFINSSTAAVLRATIARIAQARPTTFIFMHGRNDWADTTYASVAAYQTAAGAFMDALHAASPETSFFACSTWLESAAQEALVNGNGETLSEYRTAMATAASSRAYPVTFLDGTTVTGYNQVTSLFDGIHPNNQGSWQIAQWLAPLIVIPPGIVA